MKRQKPFNSTEIIISTVLQVGVLVSTVIILVGVTLFFKQTYHNPGSYNHYTTPSYSFPHSISALKNSVSTAKGIGLIELGILMLILTPILRVTTSILLFKRQKDTPMMLVTLVVLIILVSSFIIGVIAK